MFEIHYLLQLLFLNRFVVPKSAYKINIPLYILGFISTTGGAVPTLAPRLEFNSKRCWFQLQSFKRVDIRNSNIPVTAFNMSFKVPTFNMFDETRTI